MCKNNYKILLVALIFGALVWVAGASIGFFLDPATPEFNQIFSAFPPHELYERLFLLTFVMVSVAISLKTVALHQKTKEALWEGETLVGEYF